MGNVGWGEEEGGWWEGEGRWEGRLDGFLFATLFLLFQLVPPPLSLLVSLRRRMEDGEEGERGEGG